MVPSLQKEFKERANISRGPRKIVMTARIYTSSLINDGALEIDVIILDKVILSGLTNGGSGINIMRLSTMEKLG